MTLAAVVALGAARMVSSTPEFPLRLTRLGGEVDDVLLQVYDPGREKWVGWKLFDLERDVEERAVSGKAVFRAPREGEWKLRALARSRSGTREKEPETAFEVTAVYDATPPRGALWCDGGAVVWASSEDGAAKVEAAEEGVWVELGRELPATGSLFASFRPGQKVRLTLLDEAGNSSVIEGASASGSPSGSPDSHSYLLLARRWLGLGMRPQARETLRTGLRAAPRDAALAVELASLLTGEGRPAEALKVLEGFKAPDALLAAAEAHARLGNVARAVELAETVLEAAPAGAELRKKAEELVGRLEEGN